MDKDFSLGNTRRLLGVDRRAPAELQRGRRISAYCYAPAQSYKKDTRQQRRNVAIVVNTLLNMNILVVGGHAAAAADSSI